MTDDGSRALEAAIRALRERNEVLEADRQLLGSRVAELEKRLKQVQQELDRSVKPRRGSRLNRLTRITPSRLARRGKRALIGLARAAAPRRRRRSEASGAKPGGDRAASRPAVAEVREHKREAGKPRRLRVLGILDTMSAECFSKAVELHLPSPGEAPRLLMDGHFDFVLVESAWQGNGGSWQYQVGTYASPAYRGIPALRRLVDTARKRDIPTVFWNKEDPVHFAKFAEAARIFDYIFTTDAHRVGTYKALIGQARSVEALQFAAEPRLHNPLGGGERLPSPVFAGTFYQRRHADRQDSLRTLLEAAAPYGLIIYDRMHGSGQAGYDFPESVADCVVGGLPYTELVNEYRRHRVFLNANSVVKSPTMFARRVFELLACGTPVVSTPSRGMVATLPLLVDAVESTEEAKAAIERLLFDDEHWTRRSRAGIQTVMMNHTYAHRVAQIAGLLGLEEPAAGPSVALICSTADELGQVLPTLGQVQGFSEVAVPTGTPGEAVRRLYEVAPQVKRVVRFDPTASGRDAVSSAVEWTQSGWLTSASDVVGHDPSLLADLTAATVFSTEAAVAGRPQGDRSLMFGVTHRQRGDVVVRQKTTAVEGVDVDRVLLASVG